MTIEDKKQLLQVLAQGANIDIGQLSVGDHATLNYYAAEKATPAASTKPEQSTTEEEPDATIMCRAVEATMEQGLWWGSTSWAVVFRVAQIKGFKGSEQQFTQWVARWPWTKAPTWPCTYIGVNRPVHSGHLTGDVEKWMGNGAQERQVKLAELLLKY